MRGPALPSTVCRGTALSLALAVVPLGGAAASPQVPDGLQASPVWTLAPRPPSFSQAVRRFIAVDAPAVAIRDVTLIDGTGEPARRAMTVVIRGSTIEAVGPYDEVEIPEDAEVVEGAGHTLTPGWVMLHEHMFYPSGERRYNTHELSFPPLYLGGGATTIRTGGSLDPYTDLRIREDVDRGLIPGPRMEVTGPYLEGPGGFIRAFPQLRTPREARAHVEFWMDQGVTSFKAYNRIDRATLTAAVEAAHARGAKVTAHLCSITYREAADLGIDNLEHGFRAATDWVPGKEADTCPSGQARNASFQELRLESDAFLDVLDHLVSRGVAITTTPTVFERSSTGRPPPPRAALDAILPSLRDRIQTRLAALEGHPSPPAQAQFEKLGKAVKIYHDRGGLVVVGTDPTGGGDVVPGWANQRALQLLLEMGFSPEEAVMLATRNGARYLGVEGEVGTVVPGKRADLILMAGDATRDPQTFRRMTLVFKDGVGFDSAALLASVRGTVGLR